MPEQAGFCHLGGAQSLRPVVCVPCLGSDQTLGNMQAGSLGQHTVGVPPVTAESTPSIFHQHALRCLLSQSANWNLPLVRLYFPLASSWILSSPPPWGHRCIWPRYKKSPCLTLCPPPQLPPRTSDLFWNDCDKWNMENQYDLSWTWTNSFKPSAITTLTAAEGSWGLQTHERDTSLVLSIPTHSYLIFLYLYLLLKHTYRNVLYTHRNTHVCMCLHPLLIASRVLAPENISHPRLSLLTFMSEPDLRDPASKRD